MTIEDIIGQKFGLTHDRYMSKYHSWSWDRFPLRLPACEISCEQMPHATADEAEVIWEVQEGIPIVCRLNQEDGRIHREVLPNLAPPPPAEPTFSRTSHHLDAAQLQGPLGFAFEWVFTLPLKPAGQYQPTHPLGIVKFDPSRLRGHQTVLRVMAKIREPVAGP